MQFSLSSCKFLLLGLNIMLSTSFSEAFNLFSQCLKVIITLQSKLD